MRLRAPRSRPGPPPRLMVLLLALLLAGCAGDTPPATPFARAGTPVTSGAGNAAPLPGAPATVPATNGGIAFPTVNPAATATPPIGPARDNTSEGVRVTGANRWHAAGFTGKGVKVGVIEWTFNETDKYLRGAKLIPRSFRADGKTVITNEAELPYGQLHGTATAAVVHEMAPDAELYLAAITQDPESFVRAVDWLAQVARVDAISFSGGWYSGYAKDGTSPMAQAVDRAREAGVFMAMSGGNKASGDPGSDSVEGHYRAAYRDTDNDGYHDFAPPGGGRGINGMTIRLMGGILRLQLDWEGYRNPNALYTFTLTDAGNTIVATSDPARTTDTNAPYQKLDAQLPRGSYALHVKKETPDAPDLPIEIFFIGAQFPQITPEESLNIPADARGATAVGATNWRTDRVAVYASRGPTRDGRAKPDIYAPDCTTSAAYSTFGGEFCGTSAATPHVAGAAALVKGAFPDATPDEVFAWFRQYGKPLANGALRLDLGPTPPRG